MPGRARAASLDEVYDAVANEDSTPLVDKTQRRNALCGCFCCVPCIIVSMVVMQLLLDWAANMRAELMSGSEELGDALDDLDSLSCRNYDGTSSCPPPSPFPPPPPPLTPFDPSLTATTQWGPALVVLLCVWLPMLTCSTRNFMNPKRALEQSDRAAPQISALAKFGEIMSGGTMKAPDYITNPGEGNEKLMKGQAMLRVVTMYTATHADYEKSDVKWDFREKLDESVMEEEVKDEEGEPVEEVCGIDVAGKPAQWAKKNKVAGLALRVFLLVYIATAPSFLPAIPWPRTGLPQFFTILYSPFTAVVPDFDDINVMSDFGSLALTYIWTAQLLLMLCLSLGQFAMVAVSWTISNGGRQSSREGRRLLPVCGQPGHVAHEGRRLRAAAAAPDAAVGVLVPRRGPVTRSCSWTARSPRTARSKSAGRSNSAPSSPPLSTGEWCWSRSASWGCSSISGCRRTCLRRHARRARRSSSKSTSARRSASSTRTTRCSPRMGSASPSSTSTRTAKARRGGAASSHSTCG